MGYNAVVSFRNADLQAIASDADFGEHLRSLILFGPSVRHMREQRGDDVPNPFRPASMADLSHRVAQPGYDINVAEMHHASGTKTLMVRDGLMVDFSYHTAGDTPFWQFRMLAERLRDFGFETMMSNIFDTRKGSPKDKAESDMAFMRRWESFEDATTTAVLLTDNLDQLERPDAGQRLADGVWDAWKRFSANPAPDRDCWSSLITQGRVVSFTPSGETEIVLAGFNTGRVLRHTPSMFARDDEYGTTMKKDLKIMEALLRDSGFAVQNGGWRMAPAAKGNRNPARYYHLPETPEEFLPVIRVADAAIEEGPRP